MCKYNKNGMLHFKGRAKFKCKDCGHVFEAFDTEDGIIAEIGRASCRERV